MSENDDSDRSNAHPAAAKGEKGACFFEKAGTKRTGRRAPRRQKKRSRRFIEKISFPYHMHSPPAQCGGGLCSAVFPLFGNAKHVGSNTFKEKTLRKNYFRVTVLSLAPRPFTQTLKLFSAIMADIVFRISENIKGRQYPCPVAPDLYVRASALRALYKAPQRTPAMRAYLCITGNRSPALRAAHLRHFSTSCIAIKLY